MSTTIGTGVKVKIGSVHMTGELSSTLSLSRDTIDIASKETGDWAAFVPGRGSGSFSVDSVADWSDVTNYGLKTAIDAMNAKTQVSWSVTEYDSEGDPVVGAITVSGTGYIVSVDADNPDNDKAGFSMSVNIDAEPTVAVNA